MNKRGLRLLILLGVLIIATGLYVAVVLVNKNSEEEDIEDTGIALFELDSEKVAQMSWNTEDGEINLKKNGDGWYTPDDEKCPVSSDTVQTLAESFCAASADSLVAESGELAEYGLDEPSRTYTVTTTDGVKTTLSLGDYSSYALAYYANINGGDTVYLIDAQLRTSFEIGYMDMLEYETLPVLNKVSKISVTMGDREFRAEYYADNDGMSYTDSYHWYSYTGDGPVPLSTEVLEGLVNALSGQQPWTDCISYNADDETKASCGIDDIYCAYVTMDYIDENGADAVFTLKLGNYDGSYCYAMIDGSDMLYTVYGTFADRFILLDADGAAAEEVYYVDFDEITRFAVTMDGATTEFVRDGEEESTDEDGETVTTAIWMQGEKRVDAEDMDAFSEALAALESNGYSAEGAITRGEIMRVELTTEKSTIELVFEIYGSSVVMVSRDGVRYIVDKDLTDTFISCAQTICGEE